jgi:hypothetical protein
VRRCLVTLFALFLAAGCGSTSSTAPPRPRTIALDWHERSKIQVDVRRLVVRANGWSVSAAVRNNARVSFVIERPHHPGETEFGLLALGSSDARAVGTAGRGVFATRLEPAVPRVLHPGDEWSGTFSGQDHLSNVRFVRVQFGRFTNFGPVQGGLPKRFTYVTNHVLRLR